MTRAYALETGVADLERLALLNRYYNPGSVRFLRSLKAKSAGRALDVGCGQGQMAHFLAGELGPGGYVVGTDESAAQLEVASEHSPFPARCSWVQTPAEALEAAGGPFDLVYSRFLLQYTADPEAVLREMVRVLAPGGLLVVEDALVATFGFVPPRDNVRGADNWWFQLQERNGASPKFPERMPLAVQALDLTIERFESHQPVSFDREALRMHILGSQQIYPAIVAAGIAKRASTERQLRMLQSAMEDGGTYVELYRVLQIAARKPL